MRRVFSPFSFGVNSNRVFTCTLNRIRKGINHSLQYDWISRGSVEDFRFILWDSCCTYNAVASTKICSSEALCLSHLNTHSKASVGINRAICSKLKRGKLHRGISTLKLPNPSLITLGRNAEFGSKTKFKLTNLEKLCMQLSDVPPKTQCNASDLYFL